MRAVAFLTLIAFATPSLAQNDGAPTAQPEKKICRAAPPTGSIFRGKRECHTKAEWQAISESTRNARDKQDRDMRGRNGSMGISRDSGS